MDLCKIKEFRSRNSRAERGRFSDKFLLRASAHPAERFYFFKIKNSRPFFERTRAYLLPCYHLTSQLPHDSCLSRYPDFEYPDAVTFVSYVAAYLRSVCSFRVRCAAWGGIQQHFIMRLSSAGSFLFSSLLFTWSRHRLFVQYTQRQAVCQDLL